MRLGERKAVLLAISEQIEMELFSSEECCVVKKQEKKEENNFEQVSLECGLAGKPYLKLQILS